jgi:DNA polymerase III epsilon subunit-like protein
MLKDRFRKFLPVVVDLETGGFDAVKNPILEIAIQLIDFEDGKLTLGQLHSYVTAQELIYHPQNQLTEWQFQESDF